MNESNINENSIITGNKNSYQPFEIIYRTDKN